jgi:hypothetical protein
VWGKRKKVRVRGGSNDYLVARISKKWNFISVPGVHNPHQHPPHRPTHPNFGKAAFIIAFDRSIGAQR